MSPINEVPVYIILKIPKRKHKRWIIGCHQMYVSSYEFIMLKVSVPFCALIFKFEWIFSGKFFVLRILYNKKCYVQNWQHWYYVVYSRLYYRIDYNVLNETFSSLSKAPICLNKAFNFLNETFASLNNAFSFFFGNIFSFLNKAFYF